MDSTIIGDAILGAFTLAAAGISTLAAVRAGHARKVGNENAVKLSRVEAQTNGRQAELIKRAVEEFAAEHPGMVSNAVATEAVRLLLDGILEAQLGEGGRDWHIQQHRREGER